MTATNFSVWWQFCQLPDHDGLASDGPDTRWGWTFPTWVVARRWQGRREASRATFESFSQTEFCVLAEAFFWRRQGGVLMQPGMDVSVIDWVWTSGGAAFDIQRDLGFSGRDLDGLIGPKTVTAMRLEYPNPARYVRHIHDMRLRYYEDIGLVVPEGPGAYIGPDPGLGLRADDCLRLALGLIGPVG